MIHIFEKFTRKRENWLTCTEKCPWCIVDHTFTHTCSQLVKHYPIKNYRYCTGGPTLNYVRQLSLYFPHMLRANMTRDLAHLQLSDLQEEIMPICRTSDLQGERILIRRT